MVLCDVVSATASSITCITRAHIATDASATDPMAFNVEPKETYPATVQVVGCASDLSDILKLQCWANPGGAKAVVLGGGSAQFMYSWGATPKLTRVSHTAVVGGANITLGGANFGDVTTVELRQGKEMRAACAILPDFHNSSSLLCKLPEDVAAGAYTLNLVTSDGQRSVAPLGVRPAIIVTSTLTAVASGGAGSLAGGRDIVLSAGGSGFNHTDPSRNKVTVGGLPCDVTDVTATSLTCRTTPAMGRVKAEYWQLPIKATPPADIYNFNLRTAGNASQSSSGC